MCVSVMLLLLQSGDNYPLKPLSDMMNIQESFTTPPQLSANKVTVRVSVCVLYLMALVLLPVHVEVRMSDHDLPLYHLFCCRFFAL